MTGGVARLAPAELQARLASGEELVLIDVREATELAICKLEGVVHIPLGELTARAGELDPDAPVVCICHHGIRSAHAAGYLVTQRDFAQVYNLEGGVDRWALEVDRGFPRY